MKIFNDKNGIDINYSYNKSHLSKLRHLKRFSKILEKSFLKNDALELLSGAVIVSYSSYSKMKLESSSNRVSIIFYLKNRNMKFREKIQKWHGLSTAEFRLWKMLKKSLKIKQFWTDKVKSIKIPNPDSMRVKSSSFLASRNYLLGVVSPNCVNHWVAPSWGRWKKVENSEAFRD